MKYGDINLKTIDGKVYMQSRARIIYKKNTLEDDICRFQSDIDKSKDDNEIERLNFGLQKFKTMLEHMNSNNIEYVDIKEVQLKQLLKIMLGECEIPSK